ncbi:SMP-30/gluconolactonase/LRE family protein [Sphingomonas sp. MAH-20]|uniref:SMP-30/gluconolactonase/LRE family protein n=1 Tax=Sphingomonas horti TaxID=2682842 RepID=A0A6I4IXU7_9SPHN|nr:MULTISPECIES: SMP-30/gluconolactonase/LRE family protein [Sphingomonas]MBA2921045.1 SMP-30/gluconolactonase/LRE family protein [Sphingomonas sp. CGMCC 1.13658]MVO76989.1 SMP-30/gluconolactonase/LRE family protein [Sphingomonas horti]
MVDSILDAKAELGEGPRWHVGERLLYWVDIARRELHRFDPASGTDEKRVFDEPVGCFAFRKAGGLLLAMKDGFATIDDWDAEPAPFGEPVLKGKADYRFNDGRTDPWGRFWVGSVDTTKQTGEAALYRLDPDGRVTWIEGEMLTCNGAAFTADGSRFAHANTPSHALRMYDVENRKLTNRRTFHQWPIGEGRPDGGSFDEAGFYWTALFDGGRVARLSPKGEVVEEIALPVSRPTMIVFGGDDRRTAFVTSAGVEGERLSGGIFSFAVDVPGVREWPFG